MIEAGSAVPFRVRRARDEDLPAVMNVNLRSLPENYWPGFFKYVLDNWPHSFLVAEAGGEIVGYAMSRVEETADPVLLGLFDERGRIISFPGEAKRVGHLISIAVLEEYRGRGIGKALLSETIRALRDHYGVESIYLEVRVSNERAIGLYKRFGFRVGRRIPYYYRDGEDAYVMVLRVAPATR